MSNSFFLQTKCNRERRGSESFFVLMRVTLFLLKKIRVSGTFLDLSSIKDARLLVCTTALYKKVISFLSEGVVYKFWINEGEVLEIQV